jgi:5'-3' exonuclease
MADPILVDGNSLAVRCIMAAVHDELRNDLAFTGGVYGSLNVLRAVLEDHHVRAGRIVVFFDHSTPPRRLRLIPEYKQARKRDPDDLYPFETQEQKDAAFAQIHALWDLLPTLGATVLCFREREADDGLGAASRLLTARGERPLVVSSDRDLWQTVGWGCRVWDLHAHAILDAGNFLDRTGVSTDTYLLYKALVGDTSDGIAGVRGLGPKTAAELLNEAHWDVRSHREPRDQLAALCAHLGRKTTRTKREDALLQARRRIEKVLQGIDLRHSFGPTERLEARLDETPEVHWQDFLRGCKRVGLSSVLGSHQRFVRPFRRAARAAVQKSTDR